MLLVRNAQRGDGFVGTIHVSADRRAQVAQVFLVVMAVPFWVLAAIHDDRVTDPTALENISKWTNVPADVIAQVSSPGAEPNGRIDLPELTRQQDFWEREGLVPTKADLAQFVETRYLEAALQQTR